MLLADEVDEIELIGTIIVDAEFSIGQDVDEIDEEVYVDIEEVEVDEHHETIKQNSDFELIDDEIDDVVMAVLE